MILTGKLKHSQEHLSQCDFVHEKSNLDWSGIETGLPRANSAEYVATNDRATALRSISIKNERNYISLGLRVYPALLIGLTKSPSGLAICGFNCLFSCLFVCRILCFVLHSCATFRMNSVA